MPPRIAASYGVNFGQIGPCGVTADVIGASHVITYRFPNGVVFHEVFACMQAPGVTSVPLSELQGASFERRFGEVGFLFRVEVLPWRDPEPLELTRLELCSNVWRDAADAVGIAVCFPQASDSPAVPKTIVTASLCGDFVFVETAHAYPNAGVLVISRSTLTYPTRR